MGFPFKFASPAAIDTWLVRTFGRPYLRLTREDSIHERCAYLVRLVKELGGKGLRVLDVGCGSGLPLFYLDSFCRDNVSFYAGLDLHATRLAPRYAHLTIKHTFHDVDLDDDWNVGEFDFAWCSEAIEHLVDDRGVFRKICRSIRPGGHIAVTMPSRPHLEAMGKTLPEVLKISPSQDGGHVRVGYDPQSLRELCEGTPARLMRVDCATRSDLAYLRRRYLWPSYSQPLNTLINVVSRKEQDRFAIDAATAVDAYLSIIGVYEVGAGTN